MPFETPRNVHPPVMNADAALAEARRRWGSYAAINDMSIPEDGDGDAITWVEVGRMVRVDDEEGPHQEFVAIGSGATWEEAFRDASSGERATA